MKLLFPAILVALTMYALPSQGQTADAATTATDKAELKRVQNSICPVSKEAVGSMGPGKKVQHKGYEFSLCCAGCMEEFEKNPDAYLKEALKSGKATGAETTATVTKTTSALDAQPSNEL